MNRHPSNATRDTLYDLSSITQAVHELKLYLHEKSWIQLMLTTLSTSNLI